jgi:general secretion pathway protein D
MRHANLYILLVMALYAPVVFCQAAVVVPAAPSAPSAAPAALPLPAAPAPSPVPAPAAPPPPAGQPAPPALTPINQVQIQVWISETNEIGLRDIGANLQYTRVASGKATSGAVEQIQTQTFNPLNSTFNVTLPAPDTSLFSAENKPTQLRPDLSSSSSGTQTQSGAGMVMSIIQSGFGTIDGVFRGIEQKSDGDLISKPELLVIDNGIAEIHMGEQTPYQSVSYTALGAGNLVVTWQDVGVNLKLQPLILSNDSVQININQLAVSERVINRDIRGVDLPVFATRSQTGVVLVPNGQTLVIGGLSSRTIQQTERRVPILGSIPILGIPFRGRNTQSTNSHLLIFVSPTIVNLRNMSEEAKSALNFWQDRRWENSGRISKEIQVMQDEL